MNGRGLKITKVKVIRAIVSAVFVYFLVTYILVGRAPRPSIANLIEFFFLVVFLSIMFIGHGFISAFFQKLAQKPNPPFLLKTAEFLVNLLYILFLNYTLAYLPLKMLYPDDIVAPDVLRLVFGLHILAGFTHYYVLERERSQQILSKVQLETEKLEKENFQARLLMLKKQLNPQFLYHSLTSLKQLLKEDKQKARQYLRKLSEIYRMFLHLVDQHVISLKEELGLLGFYAELLQMEYAHRIEFDFILSKEEQDAYFLPSGMCQIILEDWAACLSQKEELKLKLRLRQENAFLVLSGEFNKAVKPQHAESIRHIQKTYELQTKGASAPAIKEEAGSFVLSLPLFPTISPGPSAFAKKEEI